MEYPLGAQNDAAETDPLEDATVIAALKGINENLQTIIATGDVTTINITVLGAVDDAAEVDPDAASATHASLLRGILQVLTDIKAELVTANAHLDAIETNTGT